MKLGTEHLGILWQGKSRSAICLFSRPETCCAFLIRPQMVHSCYRFVNWKWMPPLLCVAHYYLNGLLDNITAVHFVNHSVSLGVLLACSDAAMLFLWQNPLGQIVSVFFFYPILSVENVAMKDPPDLLDRQKCLNALASLRHAKWFQVGYLFLPYCYCSLMRFSFNFLLRPHEFMHCNPL